MNPRFHSFVSLAAMLCFAFTTLGQAQSLIDPKTNSITDGVPHAAQGGKALLNPNDTVLLLLDHQSGLLQNVKDVGINELRNNVVALARVATLLKIPIIYTASIPEGPNGPLIPEVQQFAPNATYVARKGEVNAWDNEAFVKAVEALRLTAQRPGLWSAQASGPLPSAAPPIPGMPDIIPDII